MQQLRLCEVVERPTPDAKHQHERQCTHRLEHKEQTRDANEHEAFTEHDPRTLAIRRWPRAIPQPGCEHVRQIAEAQRRVGVLPRIALAGSYLAGVSVADSLSSGVRAASVLVSSAA